MNVAQRGRRSGAIAVFALLVAASLITSSADHITVPREAHHVLPTLVGYARVAAGIAAAPMLLWVTLRLVGRRARAGRPPRWLPESLAHDLAVADLELILPRDALAEPYEVAKLIDGLSGVLRPRTRWRPRALLGPSPLALELRADGTGHVAFHVKAPTAVMQSVVARLTATYPGLRVGPTRHVDAQWLHVIRLKKARSWVWSLQTTKDYTHSTVGSLVHVLSDARRPATAQLLLTPVPRSVERRAARIVRARERDLRDETGLGGNPGIDSVTAQKDLKGAVEGVGRSYFWFDWRIAVERDAFDLASSLAATINELRQDNELRPRVIRIRRALMLARLPTAVPQLIPSLRTGVLSGAEIASAWHLPGARVRTVPLSRQTVRSLAAPAAISRERTDALIRDEHGPLGLRPADRRKGLAVFGAAGAGKSSVLLRYIGNVARDESRALLVCDPKEDLARDALTVIPDHRTVHYLDLAHPSVGLNVLAITSLAPEVRADIVIAALTELFGDAAVGARSDSLLRNAITAVCITEAEPTLWHVLNMLDPYDDGYRRWVIRELAFHGEVDVVRAYWERTFTGMAATNPRFLAEITEAPSNKLRRFLLVPALQLITSHPVNVDLLEVIRRREVLVVNGSKDAVGEANAALFCQLFVMLVQKTLHRVQANERHERNPAALVIDEAHNVFTPSFATMLSESRSAGLEAVAAFQYTGQITDPRVKAGVKALLQNITVTRIRDFDDARDIAVLAMSLFSDAIRIDSDDQRRLTIDPMDIINRPDNGTVNLWLADGQPQPAFTGTTIAMEPAVEAAGGFAARERHIERQRARGYHPHDVDDDIRPPALWTPLPTRLRDEHIDVDLTSWRPRPEVIDGVILELHATDASDPQHLRCGALDKSGRRFTTPRPSSLARGSYRVEIVARSAGQPRRWKPTVQNGYETTAHYLVVR